VPESVSVIIPTYNRIHTLGRALDSVFSQSRLPDEICVVDDGSTDGTAAWIKQRFPAVTTLAQENRGVSSARNRGVEATSGRWIAFLDSDDEWLPDKLEKQLQALRDNPQYQLVHTEEIWIRNGVRVNQMDKHRKQGGEIFEKCLPMCAISPSSVLLDRELLLAAGGFDEDLPACEDYDLWLKICSRNPVLYLEQALIKKYGGHEDQLSRKHWGMDRFRVQALINILQSGLLSVGHYQAAQAMLVEKSNILKTGAEKRGNGKRAEYYQQLIEQHS
jgi:glycosyltransferase involved in cell wall biosynthesis